MDLDRAEERGPRAESPLRVVALMVLSFGLLVALGTLALLPLFVVSQPCPIELQPCDDASGTVAIVLMLVVPAVAVLIGILGGVVQLVRRRPAMRWPAIACAVAVVAWVAGLAIALIRAS